MLTLLSVVMVCSVAGCTTGRGERATSRSEVSENKHELRDFDEPFVSPSGLYEADLIFRAQDTNYVYWADEEDIVWGYSGDVGAYFWVKEDGFWVEKSYADHQDAKVPQGLKDARPKYFE